MSLVDEIFSLKGKAYVVTGGAGLLGRNHAMAIAAAGGIPVVLDNSVDGVENLMSHFGDLQMPLIAKVCDALDVDALNRVLVEIQESGFVLGGLINNLDYNPPMESGSSPALNKFEDFPELEWDKAMDLGLKSAFLASRVFGSELAKNESGTIVNIASDLAVIAPDQRIYRDPQKPESDWVLKPISYSVTKFGLVGLTKYLASYWSEKSVRVNALAFGSVTSTQSPYLTSQLESRIPMGRLARPDEYKGALIFLLSDASSYMTGSVTVLDGGRSIW